MGKKKAMSKPKHSLDANRSNGKSNNNNRRSAATVRRLKTYKTRPKRNSKGKIVSHQYQSKELPNTRIQPDRRWFGNTKTISSKELELFRMALEDNMKDNYKILLNGKDLPMSLLKGSSKGVAQGVPDN